MPASAPGAAPPVRTRPHSDDAGFGLVELIVALVIVAILIAVAMINMRGSRDVARFGQARQAAGEYAQAVAHFKVANAGRAPTLGSGEWPSAITGPLDPQNRPYLPAAPEAVTAGNITVSTTPSGSGPFGHIYYERGADGRSHRLVLTYRMGGDATRTRTCTFDTTSDGRGECTPPPA